MGSPPTNDSSQAVRYFSQSQEFLTGDGAWVKAGRIATFRGLCRLVYTKMKEAKVVNVLKCAFHQ